MATFHSDRGAVNILLVPLILVLLFFLAAAAFGYWAFTGRQDYKNNVDQKITAAVTQAISTEDAKKDAQFAQDAKQPLKTYSGPEQYGAVQLSFPKTWSGYVDDTGNGAAVVDGYFYPGTVPALNDQNSSFALRLQVVSQSYADVMRAYSSYVTAGKGTINPYALPKLPKVVGVRIDGQIANQKQGSLVILPLRDKTVEIWTEAPSFVPDFNSNILPNFTFSP